MGCQVLYDVRKEGVMPEVGRTQYPYTRQGKAAAEAAKKRQKRESIKKAIKKRRK